MFFTQGTDDFIGSVMVLTSKRFCQSLYILAAADPGFPVGGVDPLGGGVALPCGHFSATRKP